MIITITGAYRNIGDHLIRHRAHQLLKKFVDDDVLDIRRDQLKFTDISVLNKANAIYLCGGPAYQAKIFPDIYDLDLNKIKTKVIPFGLGNKSYTKTNFTDFSKESLNFIKDVHERIEFSSVRDYITQQNLNSYDIKNVKMTGCPAWYNLEHLDEDLNFKQEESINSVIYSVPALADENSFKVMKLIANRFPKAKKYCALHHGNIVGYTPKAMVKNYGIYKTKRLAKKLGYEIVDLNSDINKIKVYDECDLHIGYRVHAHIYMLSSRAPSLLISEDSRGVGQSKTLESSILMTTDDDLIGKINSELDFYFKNKGSNMTKSIVKMKDTYSTMLDYLKSNK